MMGSGNFVLNAGKYKGNRYHSNIKPEQDQSAKMLPAKPVSDIID